MKALDKMIKQSHPKRMPIYYDSTDRGMANAMDEPIIGNNDWFPSCKAAHKLWRCLESMRDLEEALEFVSDAKNTTKKKRKLKIAITPLHTLVVCIEDLLNDIENNSETKERLQPDDVEQIRVIRSEFDQVLPHNHQSTVTTLRNKLSSHIDKKLHPAQAQELGVEINQHEFGRWLHICLNLVMDLTKLNIYSWFCNPPSEEYVTFMHNEPFIVTMKVDGERPIALAALNIATSSPKNAIPQMVSRLVTSSQWMFSRNQPRIISLKEDEKVRWNTFSSNLNFHKKS